MISVKPTADLWVIFAFTAQAPEGEPAASDEGALRWVDLDAIGTLPVLPDIPMLLPHLLSAEEVLTIRLDLESEDAASMIRAEILGPADRARVLFQR